MKRMLSALGALALAFTLVGCSDDDSLDDAAELRVAHLSPDAPAVDVYVDGQRVVPGASYLAVTAHLAVLPGEHRVRVVPAGASSPAVIDATLNLASGSATTVAATGLLADIGPTVLGDERSAPAGSARVRFVHASPDAPSVDVAVTGGAVLFANVAFREEDGYITVPAGTYDLEVRVAGTSAVALPLPDVVLAGATSYTVFAVGLLGNGTLGALPVVDSN
jgi:hypothetical protein